MVLALVEKAKQRLGKSALSELSVKSSTASRWKRDIIVAKRIAAHFNQNLNQKLPPTQGQIKLSGKSVFAHWANLNLGIYYPVYFPLSEINPFNIHIHGGGGERHRSFYNFSSLEDFSKTMLRATTNKAGARDWISEVERVLETLQSKFPGINPWILHYREFRNRFHSGRNPQYRTVLAPLDGPGAEALSDFPNKSETSQIHFDVMESLFPGLKDFPYDDPKKGPSREALAALTVVPVNDQAAPGRAYVAPDIDEDSEPTVSGQPLDFLIDRFERADAAELRDFMPTIYGKALKSATQVKDVGKFSHASDGENIARVLSANQVLSRTERS